MDVIETTRIRELYEQVRAVDSKYARDELDVLTLMAGAEAAVDLAVALPRASSTAFWNAATDDAIQHYATGLVLRIFHNEGARRLALGGSDWTVRRARKSLVLEGLAKKLDKQPLS